MRQVSNSDTTFKAHGLSPRTVGQTDMIFSYLLNIANKISITE